MPDEVELTDEMRAAVVAEQAAKAEAALQEQASTWNVDDWLRGASLPTTTVWLTGRADLAQQIDDVYQEMEATEPRQRTYSAADRRKSQSRFDTLCQEYEASKKPFTVRARKPGDQEAIGQAIKDSGRTYTNELALVFATAHYLTDPVMTPDQVETLQQRLGMAQFDELCEAWLKLSTETAVPSVPLSSRPSVGRRTKAQ